MAAPVIVNQDSSNGIAHEAAGDARRLLTELMGAQAGESFVAATLEALWARAYDEDSGAEYLVDLLCALCSICRTLAVIEAGCVPGEDHLRRLLADLADRRVTF